MSRFPADATVVVPPFTRQPDGDEVVIGRPDLGVFLALPPEAVELLDGLAAGQTVGQVNAAYIAKNGESPDMEDFLGTLEQAGLVSLPSAGPSAPGAAPSAPPRPAPVAVRYHFEGFPQRLAQHLLGVPALCVYGAIVALAATAAIADPALLPRRDALFFPKHFTVMGAILLGFSFATLFFHELAHLIAARAVGVSSRMGISHRLWVLVAETDMTGMWSVPRERRYLPYLAGPLLDLVCASLLVLVGHANTHGWLTLPELGAQLLRALLLMYLLSLLWQCYFFVRTDFYFVIANAFGCKNLMGDTTALLKGMAARVLGRGPAADLSALPARELRVVRAYAVIWVVGRIAALGTLGLVTLPVTWRYAMAIVATLQLGFTADPYGFIDGVLMGGVTIAAQSAGLVMWIRSLLPKSRTPAAAKEGTPHEMAA